MTNTTKIAITLAIASVLYMLTYQGILIHHYIVINRDFVPVMSYFYQTAAEYAGNCVTTLAALFMGHKLSTVALVTK
jgi:hypothetical protein